MTKEERKVWRHKQLPSSLFTLAVLGFALVKVLVKAL